MVRALLALTTGVRRGELLALRWEDVDLEGGTVWVRNTENYLTKSRKNRVLGLLPEAELLLKQLRRTFVSQLAMAGVSAAVTQKLAGHASISTTVKHYTGIMPGALREADSAGEKKTAQIVSSTCAVV